MTRTLPLDAYLALKGRKLGTSGWIPVTQTLIDQFADTTGDHQFIHVDPARAAETPMGGTIAHGFLTLSLLAAMAGDVLPEIEGAKMGLNYGLNKVRFLSPVKSGKRIRGHFTMADIQQRAAGVVQSTFHAEVEIEDENKPALSAEWIALAYV